MSELEKPPTEAKVQTEDEVAEGITEMLNFASSLPADMPQTKHLASLFAVYLDETGDMDPPKKVLDLELLRAVAALEARIAVLEGGLHR